MSEIHIPDRPKPYIMAHRGNRVLYPENTISAFQQAVSDGADIIETDVQVSSDGAFLCIHDPTLERTTDGVGFVSAQSFEQLRSYNAAAAWANLPHEPIPTIGELGNILPSSVMIALELKSDAFLDSGTCQRLAEELRREALHERTVLLSFSAPRLWSMRSIDPSLPIGWITTNRAWPQSQMEMFGPYWPLLLLNPLLVAIAHIKGQLVCPLDPIPEARVALYRLLGCDALLSDHPGQTAQALGRRPQ